MSPARRPDIEKRMGIHSRWAALAAAGALAVTLAGENSQASPAADWQTASAEQTEGKGKESLKERTDKQLKALNAQMQAMVKEGVPGVYQESITKNGESVNRLVLSFGDLIYGTNKMSYTHIVEHIRPGEKIPFSVAILRGTPQKRFKPGEAFENATILLVDEKDPGGYLLTHHYEDQEAGWTSSYYEMAGSDYSLKINKQKPRPLQPGYMSNVLNNFNGEVKGFLDWASDKDKSKSGLTA